MTFVAPPSPTAQIVEASGQLIAGLQQAQIDAAALEAMLSSWPVDLPVDLQTVVQIQLHLVDYLALLAQGVAAIAEKVGIPI